MSRSPVRRRREATGEAGVSDVLGAILLVGITVVMAAGFGVLLLSYDGPSDTQHTQLAVSVGPGADGDWGTNDAELIVTHLGGEPLDEDDVLIVYTLAGGSPTSVQPTFAGGVLVIGASWTQTITAQVGDSIPVQVVVRNASGDATSVIAGGTAVAGQAAAAMTYVTAITPVSGWGSIDAIAGAQSADDGSAATILSEGAVGGTPTTGKRDAGSTANSGAGSPDNARTDDGQDAILNANGEWVQGGGYSAPGGAVAVSAVTIGFEGRAVPVVSTVAYQGPAYQNTASGATSISSPVVAVSTGYVYVAAIATGDDVTPAPDVTSITGTLTGLSWAPVQEVANAAGTSRLEVWVGTGTAIAGTVTANFAATVDRSAIVVTRYSGVDAASPVQASNFNTGSGTGATVAAVAGTSTTGRFYAAVNGVGAQTSDPTAFSAPASSGERADVDASGEVQLGVADGAAAASNALSATIASAQPWQAVALTLRPASTGLPSVTLSYTHPDVGSPVSQSFPLTDTNADTYRIDITNAQAWTIADLTTLAIRVTLPTAGGSTVNLDHVFVLLTTTTTPTTYRTDVTLEFAETVPGVYEVIQLRYRSNGGDTFTASVWTGTAWRACTGSLTATVYTIFSCALSLPGEHNAGTPRMRIVDGNNAGTAQGQLTIEFARVASS